MQQAASAVDRSVSIAHRRHVPAPQDTAAAFCAKHGLADEVRGPLAAHIADHLANALLPTPGDTPVDTPADTPSRSDAGGSDASGNDAIVRPAEPADLQQLELQLPKDPQQTDLGQLHLRDSFFSSEEGSFVAEPLPDAAARPAEGLAYTAPSSPAKRVMAGRGGGQRAAAAADQHVARAAECTAAAEGAP